MVYISKIREYYCDTKKINSINKEKKNFSKQILNNKNVVKILFVIDNNSNIKNLFNLRKTKTYFISSKKDLFSILPKIKIKNNDDIGLYLGTVCIFILQVNVKKIQEINIGFGG